jgi:hypothetical protein
MPYFVPARGTDPILGSKATPIGVWRGTARPTGLGRLSVIGSLPGLSFQSKSKRYAKMRKYKHGSGGHAPGHIRDMFLEAVEAFREWDGDGPEPTVELEVNYELQPIALSDACGILWNCPDILPGDAFNTLTGDCELELQRRTYAAAARAMKAALEKAAIDDRASEGVAIEQCDIDQIEARYGPLPDNVTVEESAHRYRLWQAQALIRSATGDRE